ncbi:serine hydrolase domain-containing protein [Yoonia sp. 208BN28-4]|uniref:serine hydrolase domain-containing protein n=1 Tax=Yoonia sp. 208BN28-4 TaxID=3126505 RepID=UPI0030B36D75
MPRAPLDDLTRSLTQRGAGSFAFAGIALCHQGQQSCHIATGTSIDANRHTHFRAASVSKIVTGAAFRIAAKRAGIASPYDVSAQGYLGFDLRHPSFPDDQITLWMLLTHTSGLSDDGGYQFANGLAADWTQSDRFGPHRPGTYFSYSNLGYILIAACVENMTGERFDTFASEHVLRPHGIAGGFNWSGVPAAARIAALPTYRRADQKFVPQIDDAIPHYGVMNPYGGVLNEGAYRLSNDTAQVSPQGGLRLSLDGMLRLGRTIGGSSPLWRQSDGAGDYLDGVFQHYGAGLQIFDSPDFYPRPLVGHFGNAYGFNGGVWYDVQADAAFAYALNGLPMDDESDSFSDAERAIFHVIDDQVRTA